MAFAQIYICPEHGEVDGVTMEEVDTDHDEIYEWISCKKCFHTVEPLMHEGKPVMRPLTDEEMRGEGWDDDEC